MVEKDISETHNVTLQELSQHVNNVNLDDEVIVVDGYSFKDRGDYRELFPVRLDALLIILCRKGQAKINIDLKEYEISKDSLIVIQPQNYLCRLEVTEKIKTDMLICSKRVVENVLPRLTDIMPLLIRHRTQPVKKLSADDAEGLRAFHKFLKLKLKDEPTPFIKQKILCVLQAALYEMMDIASNNEKRELIKGNRKKEIMADFILEVCESFRSERQISYYADKLCITSKHLSAVVKEVSGMTASEWIDKYIIMESKILLRSTDMTIQEITSKLNFSSQSFFGKYFKHQTGYSPTEYRQKIAIENNHITDGDNIENAME